MSRTPALVCAGVIAACGAFVLGAPAQSAPRARNVVLFLADAGGLPTLAAASIYVNSLAATLLNNPG
jgi:hypothetical protein